MPHFLIFDSGWAATPTTLLGPDAITQDLATVGTTRYSVPVQLLCSPNAALDSRRISYEFYYSANNTTPFTLHWWQLFYADTERPDVSLYTTANRRRSKALGAVSTIRAPWAREQTSEAAGAGVINHYNVERVITFTPTQISSAYPIADSRWFQLEVQTVSVALAVHAGTDLTPGGRLRIFAAVNGLLMADAAEAATFPYDGILLPDAATGVPVY